VVYSVEEATSVASTIGYPVLIRPSYVLGGRAMQVVHSREQLEKFLSAGFAAAAGVLIDRFLIDAIEVDVDAISDGAETVIAGVMEHVEQAGIHSGDSSCFMPPQNISAHLVDEMVVITRAISAELSVKGFINIQFAVQDGEVFVIEANPRASRTVPFVSKASGVPWASIGTRVIMGETLASLSHLWKDRAACVAVKSPVLPFEKFRQSLVALGPEMRSTGEVMGIAPEACCAFAKAQNGANREARNARAVIFSATTDCLSQAAELIAQYSTLGLKLFIADTLTDSIFAPHLNVMDTSSEQAVRDGIKHNDIDLIISLSLIDDLDSNEHNLRRVGIDMGKVVTVSMAEARQIGTSIYCGQVHNAAPVSLQDLHAQGTISFVPSAKNLATT
jgi:carbamoyl-phosphate synthase large subunit